MALDITAIVGIQENRAKTAGKWYTVNVKKKEPFPIIYLLIILGLVYLGALTGTSIYKNYKTNREIVSMKSEIDDLKLQNENLKSLIAYYQTPSFKEKEARRKLGLVKPDEKMLIMTKEPPQPKPSAALPDESQKPNYRLWWEFFFKKS